LIAGQAFKDNIIFNKLLLFFHTLRYLKLGQIFQRVKRKLKKNNFDFSVPPELSIEARNLVAVVSREQRMLEYNKFKFLNVTAYIEEEADWNSPKMSKLWLYNLHYFDDLTSVNADQRTDWHHDLFTLWINENPPGIGNGWEPYPTSLRIVNWIKWALANNKPEDNFILSLAVQTRYLSNNLETHLLGNHLFANAKALIYGGLFFKGEEAERWYKIGLRYIEREILEQILPDGGNFELSPMYHSIFLEDLLDLINIHHVYNKKLPDIVEKKIPYMFNWLKAMCHPDGEISFFNDSTSGVAATFSELTSYAKRLNTPYVGEKMASYTHLKESGYIRVQKDNLVSIIDVANVGAEYIPGHGHADTLSFELSLFGYRIIVNSGISVYGNDEVRLQERSTAAHSTVEINGNNSSEVWSGFRVARRAKVFNLVANHSKAATLITACHDGYKRFAGTPLHCREWLFGERSLVITDKITGKGIHDVKSILPLNPKVKIGDFKANKVVLDINGNKIIVSTEGGGEQNIVKSSYHPEFGLSVENNQLHFRLVGQLPIKLTTRISW
jgi:uncharacterized heparinase superfamily protein